MLTDDKLVQLKSLQVKAGKIHPVERLQHPLRGENLNKKDSEQLLETAEKTGANAG